MDTKASPRVEVREPRFLRFCALLWIYMYGFLIGMPVLLVVAWVSFQPLGASTYLLPLTAVVLATLCLPIGFGNPHVLRLAKKVRVAHGGGDFGGAGSIVQLTTNPRLRSGLRATLEDADDIGWLEFTDTHLVYRGDAVTIELPFDNIEDPRLKNIGFRGMFVYVGRLTMRVRGVDAVKEVTFADRQSLFLPQSHRRMRRLHQQVASRMRAVSKASSDEVK